MYSLKFTKFKWIQKCEIRQDIKYFKWIEKWKKIIDKSNILNEFRN